MRELTTGCGLLRGVMFDEHYRSGALKECTLAQMNLIDTPLGRLVPQYEDDEVRRKFTSSLSFYESGALKKLSLHIQTAVKTPVGKLPAELITFYESGALMRVFPLNGKISGYWTEQNEYSLAETMRFDFPFGRIAGRVICIHFYESGAVKSLTFWPQEKVLVKTPCGELLVRTGLSLYESGKIKSVEPLKPVAVKTSIGTLTAFDIDAVGITGDANSLVFDENSEVTGIKTISETVRVVQNGQNAQMFEPCLTRSHFSDDHIAVLPLAISFTDEMVFFGEDKKHSYTISDASFEIIAFDGKAGGNICGGCR
jgi:hypothetical protein